MIRVGILTHPLANNYGGILQCYALNKVLNRMGCQTIVINRGLNDSAFKKIARRILRFLRVQRYCTIQNKIDGDNPLKRFIANTFQRTVLYDSNFKIKKVCQKYKFDAVIVGSDQVWRSDFAMKYGYNYFLDFVPSNVVKFSYAASFALDGWLYTSKQTRRIKKLLSTFKGISVRELDAVQLCKKNLGLDAEYLLDPTLLLEQSDYSEICSPRLYPGRYVFIYWLGNPQDLRDADVGFDSKGIKTFKICLRDGDGIPSLGDWLSLIKFADEVYTDSFHGTVFSIIYHKKISVCSSMLSDSRINSILNFVGKSDGKIEESDYRKIDKLISIKKQESENYLKRMLSYGNTSIADNF